MEAVLLALSELDREEIGVDGVVDEEAEWIQVVVHGRERQTLLSERIEVANHQE